MKKLIRGIIDFRRNLRPGYRKTFARLALGQDPDALFIGCSDSRVVPNLFASTEPGDLFVTRNVGNIVPPEGAPGHESFAAVLEYAVQTLGVRDIVVCGHSECGAMIASLQDGAAAPDSGLGRWLSLVKPTVERLRAGGAIDPTLTEHNQLSQLNVLTQLDRLREYPFVAERVASGHIELHGWWFDISRADVYAWEPADQLFALIDEPEADRILTRIADHEPRAPREVRADDEASPAS
ncbi:MAG: carbonic anhydrase [Polyangiales bacterium]